MLQAPNLLDMLSNNRKDAQAKAKAAQAKLAAGAKSQTSGQGGLNDLIQTDGAANAGKFYIF